MSRTYEYLGVSAVGLILVIGGFILWSQEPHPGGYDETLPSTFLQRDLGLMWQTQLLRFNAGETGTATPHASTDTAINAASRVFNTVKLVGLTREKVIAMIGDPTTSNDSVYNFPFWPAPKDALVYRFDSGAYGWQFNLLFDAEGKVRQVERQWIH